MSIKNQKLFEPREKPLALDPDTFRQIGHRLVDDIAAFLEDLPARPVTRGESPAAVRETLHAEAGLPKDGTDPSELIQEVSRLLFDHSLFNGHPAFWGYITAAPSHIGILGELLAAAVNPNVGAWTLSPIASEIEAQTVRWIAELLDYPVDCGGLLVSGGNAANFVGFFAARAAKADWDVRAKGLDAAHPKRLRVYASEETHTWLQKAMDLSGLGTDAIRWIPTDAGMRMDPITLRARLSEDRNAGDLPMLVVATAGSVSTGAVDPLMEIGALCREQRVWFHVDGAYGGFAACLPDVSAELKALREADSIAIDPHKWLYAPLEAGCALVRSPEHLRNAFSYHPSYYHFGQEVTNYVDFGPQNSRGFRALKVWLALRHAGRSGYERMIGDDIRLAKRLHTAVEAREELEGVIQELSISVFRFVPRDLKPRLGNSAVEAYLNKLNEALLDALQRGGKAFVSNAVVHGRYALRACIVNFNTRAQDVDGLPDIVVELGRRLDAEERSTYPLPG
jgi:aromatic-L-amino-acid decarboxylase